MPPSRTSPAADQFDVITLDGIHSWISGDNRAAIVDFIARKLRVGELVYISYNALQGWAGGMPLRRLFVDGAARMGGPIGPRIEGALGFVKTLRAADAGYFRANPVQVERFEGKNRSYLSHKYLNRDWTPVYHADVANDLSAARLSFLVSAALPEGIDAIEFHAGPSRDFGRHRRRLAARDGKGLCRQPAVPPECRGQGAPHLGSRAAARALARAAFRAVDTAQ